MKKLSSKACPTYAEHMWIVAGIKTKWTKKKYDLHVKRCKSCRRTRKALRRYHKEDKALVEKISKLLWSDLCEAFNQALKAGDAMTENVIVERFITAWQLGNKRARSWLRRASKKASGLARMKAERYLSNLPDAG